MSDAASLVAAVVMTPSVVMPRLVMVPAMMMRVRAMARTVRLAGPAMRLRKARHERAAGRTDAPEVGAQACLDAAAVRNSLLAEREHVVAARLLAFGFGLRKGLRAAEPDEGRTYQRHISHAAFCPCRVMGADRVWPDRQ